ncbi:Vegetative incompatibility protein [Drechslerella dactyloides]|uniref:Vegetative incompatibility protein n=1 Tax=Drechslerella dactyloides TaxID=74499 RepID=A0AAD6IV51_DREDA|nr:Vegetative incompatibility protein [Drechslerella dactyloides]
MDPLSVTASIIAVIQAIDSCWKIYSSVKDAKRDIESLQSEVASINELVKRVEKLVRSPSDQKLSESADLENALKGCRSELQKLNGKLESGKEHKFRRVIKRAKWPFTGPEVLKVVESLDRWRNSINAALNIEQVVQLRKVNRKLDFAGLHLAEGAAYGSFADQHEPECLPGTRTDLRQRIEEWVKDNDGKCIFWLSGVAGTGKSTISRTVAGYLKGERQLAASFFFRRGEKDRGNAAKFFTTLASQLANHIPDVTPGIQSAIDDDPDIPSKNLTEQFDKLIFEPLSQLESSSAQATTAVLVVDALDECDHEQDQKLIISLLRRLKKIQAFDMRIFLTSRPEVQLREGFSELSGGTYQDMVLQEAPGIEHDIGLFLESEFAKIRKYRSLPPTWPGDEKTQRLIEMAVPLFIFAATACRFIADRHRNPEKQIKIVMEYQANWHVGKLEQTYFPILHPLALAIDETSDPEDTLAKDFRDIVGTILNLVSPLSIPSLSSLISLPEETIDCMLEHLHSVLDIPPRANRHTAVRMFHLSFRDFLFNRRLCDNSRFQCFWINDKEAHRKIYTRCIELMSGPTGLRENICGLSLGILREDVDNATVEKHIAPELQYACRYWVHHLEQSADKIADDSQVHTFLRKHLLNWFEAISLSGEMREMVGMINTLKSTLGTENSNDISALVHDIRRFMFQNLYIIDKAPLQTYYSALVFSPKRSIVRCIFKPEESIRWASQLPRVQDDWDGLLQTLYGHTSYVYKVAFSHDGKTIVSASYDGTIRLWDVATGIEQIRKHYPIAMKCLALSPNGTVLGLALSDDTIRLWDTATGIEQTLDGHPENVVTIAFSPDGVTLASAVASDSEDKTVRFWNTTTGAERTMDGHIKGHRSIAFSPDGKTLASPSPTDDTVRLWDVATGALQQVLNRHKGGVNSLAFSPDGKTLALASSNNTVRLSDLTTGAERTLCGHLESVNSVTFSHDGKFLASGSWDKTIILWDTATGIAQQLLRGHTGPVASVSFSPHDAAILASGGVDNAVRLWDLAIQVGAVQQPLAGHTMSTQVRPTDAVLFSPNGKTVASTASAKTVRLWDPSTGVVQRVLSGHTADAWTFTFSPDSEMLASGSPDTTVRLWDVATGAALQVLHHTSRVYYVVFPSNSKTVLASALDDNTIKIWDTATGTVQQTFNGHTDNIDKIVFAPDHKTLMSVSSLSDETSTARLWDVATGAMLNILHYANDGQRAITIREFFPIEAAQSQDDEQDDKQEETIRFKDEWLIRRGKRLIWIPFDYRPNLYNRASYAAHGNTIGLGNGSGGVSFFTLND